MKRSFLLLTLMILATQVYADKWEEWLENKYEYCEKIGAEFFGTSDYAVKKMREKIEQRRSVLTSLGKRTYIHVHRVERKRSSVSLAVMLCWNE